MKVVAGARTRPGVVSFGRQMFGLRICTPQACFLAPAFTGCPIGFAPALKRNGGL